MASQTIGDRMMTNLIIIAKDFSETPVGRYFSDGPASGEAFRENILKRFFLETSEDVIVDLDGVEGYGSSFLEEAFGGLVRKGYIDANDLVMRLKVETKKFTPLKGLILKYIMDAANARRQ